MVSEPNVFILGDPHLGRQFVHGVPLSRRGERENLMWTQFEASLDPHGNEFHVCMGDLFDKAVVPYSTVFKAAQLYMKVAESCPETTFVILKGNHDWMRDLTIKSAFDVFALIVAGTENIVVVTDYARIDHMHFFGWQPVKTAAEHVAASKIVLGDIAFGHWDTVYSEHNMIPTKELAAKGCRLAYTGHIHKPDVFVRDEVKVTVVGSMQPYAHGEEVDDSLYITMNLAEFQSTKLDLKNRCVRLVLEPGETLEEDVDCLQLTIKRNGSLDDEVTTVSLGSFDMDEMFKQAFVDAGVAQSVSDRLLDSYNNKRLSHGI